MNNSSIMDRKIFKYLVPIYIVWIILHIIFFVSFIISQAGKETPDITLMVLLLISHFLVLIVGIAFMVYMLIDCVLRKFEKDSQKVVWVIIIVFLSILGAIIYYYMHGKKPRK